METFMVLSVEINDEKNEKEKENNTINNDESFWF